MTNQPPTAPAPLDALDHCGRPLTYQTGYVLTDISDSRVSGATYVCTCGAVVTVHVREDA